MVMDVKEIKKALQEARENLQNNPQQTVNLVRKVLKQDENNFTALILEGAGLFRLGKHQQSLGAYRLALTKQPANILGWQGIAQVYEAKGPSSSDTNANAEYAKALDTISRAQSQDPDQDKHIATTLKLVNIYMFEGKFDQCVSVLNGLIKARDNSPQIAKAGYNVCNQIKGKLTTKQEDLLHSCCYTLHRYQEATHEQYRKYFQLLYKSARYQELEAVCMDLRDIFNQFYFPIDYICRLFVENRLSQSSTYDDMPILVEKLFKLHPTSSFANFARGKLFWLADNPSEAIEWIRVGLESKFHPDASYLAVQCLLALWDFEGAEDECSKALALDLMPMHQNLFKHGLVQSLIGQNRANEALDLVDSLEQIDIDDEEDEISLYKAKCYFLLDKPDELSKLLENVRGNSWQFQYLRILHEGSESLGEKLHQLCKEHSDNFYLNLTCGVKFYELGDYIRAAEILSKCLSSQERHPILLYHIGCLYKDEGELETALSYLSKAYREIPTSKTLGETLSDLLYKMRKHEENLVLLTRAIRRLKRTKSKWACMRLGMIHLELNNPADAVVAFQSAIRADYSDPTVWTILGEAYYLRGSLDAAYKSFERALSLGVDSTYPKWKMGVIAGQRGYQDEAVKLLTELVEDTGDESGLVELGRIWLKVARKGIIDGLNLSVIEAISNSIQACARVKSVGHQYVALCIMSEAVLVSINLNLNVKSFKIPAHLFDPTKKMNGIVEVGFNDLFTVGINAAKLGLNSFRSVAVEAYHHCNLAKLYYFQALLFDASTIHLALYHAKKAISLDQSDCKLWTVLGVIADFAKDTELALHGFLNSIKLKPFGNALVWVNLGFMCSEHKAIDPETQLETDESVYEAHRCFSEAQRLGPSLALPWIGQGVVAAHIQPLEALDLFRHASTLDEPNFHSHVHYAYWVCRTLLNPKEFNRTDLDAQFQLKHLDALHIGLEKIDLYNIRRPSVTSQILQGIIQLFIGLHEPAYQSFRKAKNFEPNDEEQFIIDMNIICARQKLLKHKENLEFLSKMPQARYLDFRVVAAFALAFLKVGDYENAFATYEKLTTMGKDKRKISDSLIAQGITANLCGNFDVAKLLMFQGCELSGTPEGYMALCAAGLENYDVPLATSALQKMEQKFGHARYIHHFALLKQYCDIIQENPKANYPVLSCIREYPLNPKLYQVLGEYYINFKTDGSFARHSLRAAQKLGGELVLPQIALTYLMEGNLKEGYNYALRAMRANTLDPTALAVVVASLSMLYESTQNEIYHNLFPGLARKGFHLTFEPSEDGETKVVYHVELYEWFQDCLAYHKIQC